MHGTKDEAAKACGENTEVLKAQNEKEVKSFGPGESFGVPYRCLTPKNMKNVLVAGRCISTDRPVNGSVRIMACCLTTGEAAGIASAMSAEKDANVHHVNTDALRRLLRETGAYLP